MEHTAHSAAHIQRIGREIGTYMWRVEERTETKTNAQKAILPQPGYQHKRVLFPVQHRTTFTHNCTRDAVILSNEYDRDGCIVPHRTPDRDSARKYRRTLFQAPPHSAYNIEGKRSEGRLVARAGNSSAHRALVRCVYRSRYTKQYAPFHSPQAEQQWHTASKQRRCHK